MIGYCYSCINTLAPIVHFWLCHTALACRFCISRKDETGGGGWVHPDDSVCMAAAGIGCKMALVGTRWANSCLGCTNGLT